MENAPVGAVFSEQELEFMERSDKVGMLSTKDLEEKQA
jgi:hypothetical protein